MVDHRRTPSRKAYVLPGWFFVLSTVASAIGLIGLVVVLVLGVGDQGPTAAADSGSTDSGPTASPTPSSTPSRTPSPSPSPTPTPEPTPTVGRGDISVAVLNATRTSGLARQVSGRVQQAGWSVAAVGNWRSGAAQTAVHFPSGHKAEARLLANDLGIGAVLPSTAGMDPGRLTVILLGLP